MSRTVVLGGARSGKSGFAGRLAEANWWNAFPRVTALQRDSMLKLDGELLNRAGPRMIAGAAVLCETREIARQHWKNQP